MSEFRPRAGNKKLRGKSSLGYYSPGCCFCFVPLLVLKGIDFTTRTPQWLANGLWNDLPMAVLGLGTSPILSRDPGENGGLSKRTMVEKNGEPTLRSLEYYSTNHKQIKEHKPYPKDHPQLLRAS